MTDLCSAIVRQISKSEVSAFAYTYIATVQPRAGSGVVKMDPLRFLAGCRTRRLNQA